MFLKCLELQGFKSFPDKTKVTFGEGLTAVVGPNGSGKSNISDAVRWVLGEQSTKNLRGEKMEDVIFSGTQKRKAQGFAEVSLTLDNQDRALAIDTNEVIITRRYDRSGESEYMINRSPVRLKDLHELLMDTGLGRDGYSQVGQGKIEAIVTAKSTERREIFEEAAGISKYRYRKLESERSLEKAEENLVRLRDILAELEARIGPLKEQSEKAKKYLALASQKKTVEISICIDTIDKSNQKLKDQSDKLLVAQNHYDEIEEQVEQIEADIQQMFAQKQNLSISVDALRRKKEEMDTAIADVNSQIAVCKNDILHNTQNIERVSAELEQKSTDFAKTDEELLQKQAEKEELQQKLTALKQQISEKETALLKSSGETEGITRREAELNERLNALMLEQSEAKMTIAACELSLQDFIESLPKLQEEKTAKEQEISKVLQDLTKVKSLLFSLDEKAEELNNAYAGQKLKLDLRAQKLAAIKTECDTADLKVREKEQKIALLTSMEQSLEGYQYSVREVIKRAKNNVLRGVRGTVSQLVDVKNEYSVAIETALGAAMQNIVVDDEESAKAAIKMLKENRLGRATFLPITAVKGQTLSADGIDRYAGFIDTAVNLVHFEEEYRPVMNYLLGRTAIVEDIDTAVLIARKYSYKFRIVTLDGQVVNAGGSLTGGSQNKSSNLLSRKSDIDNIKKEIISLRENYQSKLTQAESLKAETAKIEADVTAILSELRTIKEDKIRAEGELSRLDLLNRQGEELLERMNAQLCANQNKSEEQQKLKEQKEELLQQIAVDTAGTKDELVKMQSAGKNIIKSNSALGDELSELKINSIELSKDIEAADTALTILHDRKAMTDSTSAKLQDEVSALTAMNEQIVLTIESLEKGIADSKTSISEIDGQIKACLEQSNEAERISTQKRQRERELSEQKSAITADMARIEERKAQIQKQYDDMIARLWDEYELTKSEAQTLAEPLEDPQKATTELNSLRNRIRALGSVNVDAIEEYQEVGERYEFLSEQVKDAEKSRAELIRLINDLTVKMRDIFAENFVKINENFSKIFVELFGGGRAELKLTEPDDILESGIEIFAEPPGKTFKNLTSLSGGEKAFVAIAIYFAILKIRPAPFCVLDEIEAALDDVNVDKYAAYLQKLTDKTQFIAITHRRGTMEAADVLYGVTMQDSGISKLLQLKVSEIESKLHMITDSK